jgi:hypothetical protein
MPYTHPGSLRHILNTAIIRGSMAGKLKAEGDDA